MLPPLAACRRALVVAAAAVLTSPRSLRAAADVDSTAGLRLDGAALQRAQQQLNRPDMAGQAADWLRLTGAKGSLERPPPPERQLAEV